MSDINVYNFGICMTNGVIECKLIKDKQPAKTKKNLPNIYYKP